MTLCFLLRPSRAKNTRAAPSTCSRLLYRPIFSVSRRQRCDSLTQIDLLKKCAELTPNVFIVTNSPPGWLQSSSCRLLPRLAKVIKELRVGVISARGIYQSAFPCDPGAWKVHSFEWIGRRIVESASGLATLIVVGDSDTELVAGKHAAKTLKVDHLKQVQVKASSIAQMEKQLGRLISRLDLLCKSSGDELIALSALQ